MTTSAEARACFVFARIIASSVAPASPSIGADGLAVGEVADVDGNHAVGAHLPDDVGGDVVHGAAVDQQPAVVLDRREDQRQRHRRPHRGRELAAIEHDEGCADFRSTATERNGVGSSSNEPIAKYGAVMRRAAGPPAGRC